MTQASLKSDATGDLPRLPTDPKDLTPDMLSAVIARMHPSTRVDSAEVLESTGIGLGVSTTGRGKMRLRYAANPANLPEYVQVKMIVGERSPVPPFLFETEVRMYERMIPRGSIERAQCLAAVYENDTQNFILLLEDLTRRGAKFTNIVLPPYTPDEVGTLLDLLATVHAQYWESPGLDEQKDWLSSHLAGNHVEVFDKKGHILKVLTMNVENSTYRQDFIARAGHSVAELWEMVKKVQRYQARTLPNTLCHGDTGAHNSYRLPDGGAGYVDWQLSVKATWPHDVHYLICTGLSVKDRRDHERALVARYLNKLKSLGVRYEPSLDDAMSEYSLAIIWGLVIGWFCVRPYMYGPEITMTSIERLFAAANDHDIFNRIARLA